MKVLLVGATGRMGRAAASLLARRKDVDGLTLAARRPEAAPGTRAPGVRRVVLDLDDPAAGAIFGGHDVVLSCAGPASATEPPTLEAALEARVPYVSLCDDPAAFAAARALDDEARRAGVAAIPGCGLSPGLSGVLFARAATALDEVSTGAIAVAEAVGDGVGPAALAQLQTLTFQAPAPVFFPEPVGWVETFLVPHPEPETLPGVVEARRGLTERGAMDVVRASAATGARGDSLIRRLAPVARLLPPRGPAWSAARVDVHGTRGGAPATVTLGVVDHLANLAAATAVRVAAAAGGGAFPPGVHALHEVADRGTLLGGLAASGVRIARLEPEPL